MINQNKILSSNSEPQVSSTASRDQRGSNLMNVLRKRKETILQSPPQVSGLGSVRAKRGHWESRGDFFMDNNEPQPLPRGIVSDTTITVSGYLFRKIVKEVRTKRKLKYETRFFCLSENVPNKVKANRFGTGYKSIGAFFTAWEYYKDFIKERKWRVSD